MKIKIGIHELMLPVILACFAGCTSDKEAKLQAQAGISKTQAETIALARTPIPLAVWEEANVGNHRPPRPSELPR